MSFTAKPLLLQPLVENAIRHGHEPPVQGGHIHIRAQADAGQLCSTVQDKGTGFDTDTRQHTPGFALAQLRERMTSVHGPAGQMAWQSAAEQGTLGNLRWPLASPGQSPATWTP